MFDDADIETPVKGAIASKYRNAGQTCVCANRILVQDGVYDAFTKRLAETAGAMKVADGFEPGAVIGPLIDMKAVEKVEAHIAAETAGVRNTWRHCEERSDEAIWVGSGSLARDCLASLAMTLVTTDVVITKEETFDPVAPLYPGEIASFGGSNRPPAFSLAGALKRPTFPSPRCRSHTRRPPMHLLGW